MQQKLFYTVLGLLVAVGVFTLGMSLGPRQALAPTTTSALSGQASTTVSFLLDNGVKITGFEHQTIPTSEPTVLGLLKQVAGEKKLTLDVDMSSSMGAF